MSLFCSDCEEFCSGFAISCQTMQLPDRFLCLKTFPVYSLRKLQVEAKQLVIDNEDLIKSSSFVSCSSKGVVYE